MYAIVLGHTLPSCGLKTVLYAFHVPLFFILSGITYQYSQGIADHIKKLIYRLLLPYLCFGVLSVLAYCLLGAVAAEARNVEDSLTISEMLIGLIYGSGTDLLGFNKPLWFLPCLFILQILVDGIHWISQRSANPSVVRMTMITAFLAFGIALTVSNAPILPFGFSTALYMLPFFGIGEYIASVKQRLIQISKHLTVAGSIVLVFAGLGFVWLNYKLSGHAQISYPHNVYDNLLLFYFGASGISLGVIGFSIALERCAWIECVGRNTLQILVLHKFPVLLFQIILNGVLSASLYSMMCFGIAATSIVISIWAASLLSRWAPWVFGIKTP